MSIDDTGDVGTDVGARTWVLIAGNRLVVSGILVLGLLLVLVGGVQFGVISVGPSSSIRTLLTSGVTSGLLALITVSLSINQLLLSRVFGSPGELERTLEATIDFREHLEDLGDLPVSPNHPIEFLGVHGALLAERVGTLSSAASTRDGAGDDELAEFCDFVEAYADHLEHSTEAEGRTFDALAAVLGPTYADLLQEARRLRRTREADLSAAASAALDDVETLLRSIAVLRQFFKTTTIQQDLARLSQLVAYSGFVAVVTAYALALVYESSSGAMLPADVLAWVAPLGLAVTAAPLAILIAYTLRVATVSRYTVSVGPFVPPEERFGE